MEKPTYEDPPTSISKATPGSDAPRVKAKRPARAFTGFGVAMLFLLAFAVFMWANFKTVQVSGRSMLNTFKDGQRVLVSRAYWLIGPIRDKDVVVLKDTGPTGYIIKRVYKMAGETVDWKYVPENYPIANGPLVVPDNCVYVLGDNLPESEDSRKFGPRPVADILGKVIVRP